jgi:hypothetical protein
MPITNFERRPRELGRIRIGQQVTGSDGKTRPAKLDKFRFTAASRPLLEQLAELYGGEVHVWQPKAGAGGFEVITDADRIPIFVPPQPVTQWLETWSAGGCVHRCDGLTDALTGGPCAGGPDHEVAKPTTRLRVVLRDVAAVGVFRLESHGWNAAAELPDMAAFLSRAPAYVEGWLALEERTARTGGQTKRFVVPVIEITMTPAQLLAGRIRPDELEAQQQRAIESGFSPVHAHEAGPIESAASPHVDTATGEVLTGCAHALTTPLQIERGECNRCYTAPKAAARKADA